MNHNLYPGSYSRNLLVTVYVAQGLRGKPLKLSYRKQTTLMRHFYVLLSKPFKRVPRLFSLEEVIFVVSIQTENHINLHGAYVANCLLFLFTPGFCIPRDSNIRMVTSMESSYL